MSVYPSSIDLEVFLDQLATFSFLTSTVTSGPGNIAPTAPGGTGVGGLIVNDGENIAVEFTYSTTATPTFPVCGLTTVAPGLNPILITYAFLFLRIPPVWNYNNGLFVLDNLGVPVSAQPFENGDIFRIEIRAGVPRYYQNGQLLFTSPNLYTSGPIAVAAGFLSFATGSFDDVKVGSWLPQDDVQVQETIRITRGIQGTTYRDRVAQTGDMSFNLDNSERNSVGTLGYYSPNNANVREGWRVGVPVRARATFMAQTKDLFWGTVESITPRAGKFRTRRVSVNCVDFMDDAARSRVTGLPLQENKRSDEIFEVLLDAMDTQPINGQIIQVGGDEYPVSLDNALASEINVMSEWQRLIQSEQGFIWVRRDGKLIFESRHKRFNTLVNAIDLTGDDTDNIGTERGRNEVFNRVEIQVHPRRIDAAPTSQLFLLNSTPKILRNTAYKLRALYRDPAGGDVRVGGKDMIPPVATTDYLLNSQADGAGTDLTAQISVVRPTTQGEFDANSVEVELFNNGPADGFLTLFQLRGRGIFSYETVVVDAESKLSQKRFGENALPIDMPYQDDPNIAQEAADFVIAQAKDIYTQVDSVAFWANRDSNLMMAAFDLEISDRIGLTEEVIGDAPFTPIGEEFPIVATNFYINSVELVIFERGIIRCTWRLVPADPFAYWILERDGFTELDLTTRLGYGSFIAGWVLDDSQLGTGTRINQ